MRDTIRMLLVEDSSGDVRLLMEMLAEVTSVQFEVLQTVALKDALASLRSQQGVDVVLLDLGLPDSRGYETFAQVRAQAPAVPIVVLTLSDDDALALTAVEEGAQDYLVKGTVDSDLLVRSIRYAMARKRLEESERDAVRKLEEMRRYEAVHAAREEEQKKIASELHDDILASLARLGLDLSLIARELKSHPALGEKLVEPRQSIKEIDRRLREIVQGMYPSTLTELGLMAALNSYLSKLAQHPIVNPCPLEVTFRATGFGGEWLPEAEGIAIYRTIEQAMTNVIAHADASRVEMSLEWRGSKLQLRVSDNGKGFDKNNISATPLSGHFGIASLRYRTEGLGGDFEIDSQLGAGTSLRSRIPTKAAGGDETETTTTVVIAPVAHPETAKAG